MRIEVTRDQVLKAFAEVADNPVFAQSAQLVKDGAMPLEMIRAMCVNPGVLSGFASLSESIYPGGSLDRDIQELVILAASAENACQFCTSSHHDIARSIGLSDDPVGLLDAPSELSRPQRLAVEWTRGVMRDSNRITDELFQEVQSCFGDAGTVELTVLVGYINMLNMFNNALRNSYHGEMDPDQACDEDLTS